MCLQQVEREREGSPGGDSSCTITAPYPAPSVACHSLSVKTTFGGGGEGGGGHTWTL